MNRAIFLYTLYVRMRSLPVVGTMFLFCVILPVALSLASLYGARDMDYASTSMVLGAPAIAFVLAFTILRDSFADTRTLNEGEYLTLLFTRPVSRAEYVFTKWLTTAGIVTVLLLLQVLIYHTGQTLLHADDSLIWNATTAVNIVLNSLSSCAIISAINAFPRKYAIWLFILTSYSSVLGRISNSTWRNESAFIGEHHPLSQQIDVSTLISMLLNTRIDAFDLFNAVSFPWTEIVSYLSNITLYLLLATYLLTRREFFYASE